MAVYLDYTLKPSGKSLLTMPDVMRTPQKDATDTSDGSPVMVPGRRFYCSNRCCFRTAMDLGFEQRLLKDKGAAYAFAGVLDRPPSTSFEIMNPVAYERSIKVPLLTMPDVHSLLDHDYQPYDIGIMGEFGCAHFNGAVWWPGCGGAVHTLSGKVGCITLRRAAKR